MILVKKLKLQEFRGVRKCETPIELSKFTVIVGRNNAGKSAILEALSLLPHPKEQIPVIGKSKINFISNLHSGPRSLIYGYSGTAWLEFEINSYRVKFKISDNGVVESFIGERKYDESSLMTMLSKMLGIKIIPGSLALFLPNSSGFIDQLRKNITREGVWEDIEKNGINVSVVRDLISRVVSDVFTEAYVGRNDILLLRKEVPSEKKVLSIKVSDLGDGVERVLVCVLWLERYMPRLVLWDDIEASAHPGLIETLLEWLSRKDWQVVISTHSIDVLDRLVQIEPRDASLITLNKDERDVLKVRSFKLDDVEDIMDKGIDLRKTLELL